MLHEDMETGFKTLHQQHAVIHSAITDQTNERCKRQVELSLLESLRFETMTHRHDTIPDAHQRTFEWIFREQSNGEVWSNFCEWLESGSGIYWINGKAGSGKSTLMRFIAEDSRTRTHLENWAEGSKLELPSFYFWNSGVLEQRSQAGLLRTMLYQILSQYTELMPIVFPEEWSRQLEYTRHNLPGKFGSWSLLRLQIAFKNLIQQTSEQLRFCFFIDGFDEYEGDHEELAEYFFSLSDLPSIKFCVSSRPWQVFTDTFYAFPSLRLQDLTHDDIQLYIKDKLEGNKRMKLLFATSPSQAKELVEEVMNRADGVFLWVSLAIKSLLNGLSYRDGFLGLMKRLSVLPPDLDHLYAHMLNSIEPIYREDGSKAFLLVRTAERVVLIITPEEMHLALTVDLERVLVTSEKDLQLAQTEPIPLCDKDKRAQRYFYSVYDFAALNDYMDVWLRTRCGGLLEIAGRWVLYIHRTVRDFLKQNESLVKGSGSALLPSIMDYDPRIALCTAQALTFKRGMLEPPSDVSAFDPIDWLESVLWKARAIRPSNVAALVLLLDECDRSLSLTQLRIGDGKTKQVESKLHWSNQGWPRTWETNFLHYAIEKGLPRYVETKLAASPSLLEPKSGIPLLAFCFLSRENMTDLSTLSILESMEILLEHGANPNDCFEGYSVWQDWVHFAHETLCDGAWSIDRPRLERIFRLLLQNCVDLEVCCLQQSLVWDRIFDSQGINSKETREILKDCQYRMLSHGKESRGLTSDAGLPLMSNHVEEEQWKEHHCLTAVIQDIFNTKEKPDGANELLELVAKLKADKRCADQSGSGSQKQAPRRKKRRGKESKKVQRGQVSND